MQHEGMIVEATATFVVVANSAQHIEPTPNLTYGTALSTLYECI